MSRVDPSLSDGAFECNPSSANQTRKGLGEVSVDNAEGANLTRKHALGLLTITVD
jgi:hypothetical protein